MSARDPYRATRAEASLIAATERADQAVRELNDACRIIGDLTNKLERCAAAIRETERAAYERAATLADGFPEDFASTAPGADISTWGEGVSEGFWHGIFKYRDAIRALAVSVTPEETPPE